MNKIIKLCLSICFSFLISSAAKATEHQPKFDISNYSKPLSATELLQVKAVQNDILTLFPPHLLKELPPRIQLQITASQAQLPTTQNCSVQNSSLLHKLVQTVDRDAKTLTVSLPARLLNPQSLNKLRICAYLQHKNPIATLIAQEFLRHIDRKNTPALLSKPEREKLKECRIAWQAHSRSYGECQKLLSFERTFTDRPEFKSFMLANQARKSGSGTFYDLGSADPIEYANPETYFAINGSLFLMDPQFTCRRPDLASFLSRKLNQPWKLCEQSAHFPVSPEFIDATNIESLQPYRQVPLRSIYEVHYLLADDGTELISSFGHALFRLVICAPERQKKGPECLGDTEHHLVASFQAIVDSDPSPLKEYPTRLIVEPLSQTIKRYSIAEGRALRSYALRLSDQELRDFVFRLSFAAYNYQSTYGFIKNNCATQAVDLVTAIIHRPLSSAHWDQMVVTTPKSVIEYLADKGLLINWSNDNEQKKYVTYFPSMTASLEKSIAKIKNRYPDVAATFQSEVVEVDLVYGLSNKIAQLQKGRSTDEGDAVRRLAFAYAERRRVELRTKIDLMVAEKFSNEASKLLAILNPNQNSGFAYGILAPDDQIMKERVELLKKQLKVTQKVSLREITSHPLTRELKALNTEMSRL